MRIVKVPVAPHLDDEQRRAGYDRALRLRRQRADLKQLLKHGSIELPVALDYEEAQGMKVFDLLKSLPGYGQRRVEKLLDSLGIAQGRTVAQLGPRQLEAILASLSPLEEARAS